jgi:hypothetical protein
MKQRLQSAKFRAVTIDGTNGACTPTPPKIKLNKLEDVRLEMAKVYRDARSGRMDASEAGRLAYILVGIGKLIEATDIERRLVQMERKFLK